MKKFFTPKNVAIAAISLTIGGLVGVFLIPNPSMIGGKLEDYFLPYNSGLSTAVESGYNRSFACSGIHSAFTSYLSVYEKIESDLHNATDELAVTVYPDGESMTILTGASVGAGVTQGDPMTVVYDDGTVIVGIGQHGTFGASHSILQINRETGLGFWVKTASQLFESGQVVSLRCF